MISCRNQTKNKQLRFVPELKGGDETEMEKEETRLVIVCEESKNNNVTVYTNNPHADAEELISMLTAHVAYFIRNMLLDHVPPSDVAKMLEMAVKIAADRYMDSEEGDE